MTRYWYTTCRNCNRQGRLFIMNNLTSKCLYLHCEECESGWVNPLEVDDVSKKFLTLTSDFDAEIASSDDIEQFGWQRYATNRIDD